MSKTHVKDLMVRVEKHSDAAFNLLFFECSYRPWGKRLPLVARRLEAAATAFRAAAESEAGIGPSKSCRGHYHHHYLSPVQSALLVASDALDDGDADRTIAALGRASLLISECLRRVRIKARKQSTTLRKKNDNNRS